MKGIAGAGTLAQARPRLHVPRSHSFVERLIGTTRPECLDYVLFWNARDLERTLADFQAYNNEVRNHAS